MAYGRGRREAGDDAGRAAVFTPERLPEVIAFDPRQILADYFAFLADGSKR
jgi:hypothetical protein